MHAKRIVILITLFALCLSACTTATPGVISQMVEKTVEVQAPGESIIVTQAVEAQAPVGNPYTYQQPLPTAAPYATQAPVPGTVPTPVDTTFQDYGINPYIETTYDHLSTFALDVDTASYTIARSYLNDGNLPPADSIRVEEFVNYFEQDYHNPDGAAFAIFADGAPSPFQPDTYLLRFGIQGYEVPEWERKPLSLVFVIDVSGSMADSNRLEMVKDSLSLLVDRLGEQDSVGIVAYTNTAWVVLDPTNGSRRSDILNAIYTLFPQASTNVEAGITLGYQMAIQNYRAGAVNRVILASDGVANQGIIDPQSILDRVHGYVAEGVTLTTIGVGMNNFNDGLLEQLADNGDGNYAYVDTIEEAHKVFVEDLTSTMQVIARDAKVQVDFNNEVVARYRLIGYENRAVADSDFRNDTVDAGEIGAGHSVTALYAVQLYPGREGRIGTVQLRWEDPNTYTIQDINGNFNTWDITPSFQVASPRYQLSVIAAQFAEELRGSHWAGYASFGQLAEYGYAVQAQLPEDPEVAELVSLLKRASEIAYLRR
jgi:Ca-activated chloride channel family protein